MSKPLVSGYCNWCAENMDHGYYAKSALAGLGHWFIRIISGSSGYGPWYCSGCRRVTSVIVPPMDAHPGSHIDDAIIDQGRQTSKSLVAVSPEEIPQASDSRRPLLQANQPARRTNSSSSSSRYSQKYRFAVAKRIIEGHATFKQIGAELSVSKHEIWSWLVEHFQDSQYQIAELKKQIRLIEESAGVPTPEISSDEQIVSVDADVERSWSTTVVVDSQQLDNP